VEPFVSVIVPLLNEEPYVERLMRSLLDQDYPRERYEILAADGGSTDRTLEILRALDQERRIRILDNPRRTAPAAMNVAVAAARGEIITRIDGHSRVAPDYLRRIVAVMEETGEAVVGGPVLMEADTPFRRALIEALNSKVGVGSVPYRTLRQRAYVESLQTGSFRREVLDKVGPFDESLAVVEDLDMNTRIREAGFRLLLDPSIRFWYYPRPNLRALARQIHMVGLVKARILRKHPAIFKLKYALPSVFVVAASLAAVAAILAALGGPTIPGLAGAGFLAAYAVAILAFSASTTRRLGLDSLRLLAILPVLHVGYGIGFLRGATEILSGRWRPDVVARVF
jgi:cellulose synthase/poly-beta-1,6-N-acetylglucosamine synthase-like glycosyltransferase